MAGMSVPIPGLLPSTSWTSGGVTSFLALIGWCRGHTQHQPRNNGQHPTCLSWHCHQLALGMTLRLEHGERRPHGLLVLFPPGASRESSTLMWMGSCSWCIPLSVRAGLQTPGKPKHNPPPPWGLILRLPAKCERLAWWLICSWWLVVKHLLAVKKTWV